MFLLGAESKYFGETVEALKDPYCWPPPDGGEGLQRCVSIVVVVPVCARFESSFLGSSECGSCWIGGGESCWLALFSIGKNIRNIF